LYLNLRSSSVEAPLSIGDSSSGHGHERSPLAALPLPDGATVREEVTKRPQPTEEPTAAFILAEGSLNDNKKSTKVGFY
jgi:hypothetical protein